MKNIEGLPNSNNKEKKEDNTKLQIFNIAKNISDYTVKKLEVVKEITQNLVERTIFTHRSTLLYLESIIIKTFNISQDSNYLNVISKLLYSLGIVVSFQEIKEMLSNRINIGDHMEVYATKFRSPLNKKLEDGTTIYPGDEVGMLDITRDIPTLGKSDNLITVTKQLFFGVEKDLAELAKVCQQDNSPFKNISVFVGISHLSNQWGKRLGFDVFEISDPLEKLLVNLNGIIMSSRGNFSNKEFRKHLLNFKSAKEAYISKQRLIELYGNDTE